MLDKSLKTILIFLLFLTASASVIGQDCNLSISGIVIDESTGLPISGANVFLENAEYRTTSNSNGKFVIKNICPDEYHIVISHVGCDTKRDFIALNRDTVLTVKFEHYDHILNGIVVESDDLHHSTKSGDVIDERQIIDDSDKSLGNLLGSISGVNTIKNGTGLAKPVVHGLFGNRLTILNNGIAQSGQQWGNDHSPEIDPLVANKITVVKGAGIVEYQGGTLGSVILVEPNEINKEPHFHGKGSYFFQTNGLGHGINFQAQKGGKKIAWKINGTLKKNGDRRTPTYFLNNTGGQEANFALQLEKHDNKKWDSDLYFSSFNTTIGVLRGSHIGNLTDLNDAFEREVPFFTEDEFSYNIDAPKQTVNHNLLKLHTRRFISKEKWFDFTYAGQWNLRREFDVRKNGKSVIPALSLSQFTNFFEGKYNHFFENKLHLRTGIQYNYVDNTNNPETGILPLIPDYRSYETGGFVFLDKKHKNFFFELGGRYDFLYRDIVAISKTIPREIIRDKNEFHNYKTSGGISYRPKKNFALNANLGYSLRNPAINELYSNGLHQGVSGIEEGDTELSAERSVKATLGLEGKVKRRFFFEALAYIQQINDYIYLNPQDEIRLTIRGAFPVFRYEQTKAQLYGADLTLKYELLEHLELRGTYSYIQGNDLSNNVGLIFIPANTISGAINYEIANLKKIENIEVELNSKYTFQQTNIEPWQDFAPPPEAYNLLGAKISAQRQFKKSRIYVYSKVSNLLNEQYRDYLNRQRYFSNDLGINFTMGFSLSF